MNQFLGQIPSTIGGLQGVINLSSAHNRLQGPIPHSIGSLVDLEFCDVSRNNLSSVIPAKLQIPPCHADSYRSFSSTYKGMFPGKTIFAAKVFKLELDGAFKSLEIECDILCNIRHRNLTKVISSCSTLDFKALVLEYMPNGTLEK
ncbi:hypothetical protein ACSBR1_035805 [Camellia fascicularis]